MHHSSHGKGSYRSSISKSKSKKIFRESSKKTNVKNIPYGPTRGGIRL